MGLRLNLFVRVFVLAFVIAAVSLFFSLPEQSLWLIASIGIAMGVALVGIVAVSERASALKSGMPLEDELSRKITWKAGYYAFVAGLWLAIGLMAGNLIGVEFLNLREIDFRYAFEAIIVVQAVTFTGLIFWFRNKGKIE